MFCSFRYRFYSISRFLISDLLARLLLSSPELSPLFMFFVLLFWLLADVVVVPFFRAEGDSFAP
jgi:hypothetical protein